MKKIIAILTVLPVLLALLLAGCTVDDPASSTGREAPAGEFLFSNYVAMGNSLTAGFMDGGLSIVGQNGSYPKHIAAQIGAPSFTMPYIDLPGVGTTRDAENHPADVAGVMYWNGSQPVVMDWTPAAAVPTLLLAMTQPTPYHDMGVPGATLHDIMNAIDATTSTPPGNSYFDFINRPTFFGNISVPASGQTPAYESTSMFRACIAKGPKVLTLWIGNNEILGPAMSGTSDGIVNAAAWQAEYTAMILNLAGGLQGRNEGWPTTIVLGNIPSITSAAYFVPRAFLEADPPNGAGIVWPGGYEEPDAVIVNLPGVAWIAAMTQAGQFTTPVPANYTLSVAEVTTIEAAVTAYNNAIDTIAATVNGSGLASCAVFDANALLAGFPATAKLHFMFLEPALGVEGAAATTLFSLDGVHPNLVGYGHVANGFLAKIRELTEEDIEDVDVSGLSWDPTYGIAPDEAKSGNLPMLSMEAAESVKALFSH